MEDKYLKPELLLQRALYQKDMNDAYEKIKTLESEVKKLTDFIREYQEAINNYHKIKSQLSVANLLIKEQIEEICGLKEILGSVKTKIEMAEYCDMAWLDLAKEEIDKALSSSAPVDEEKEVLKEALRLACEDLDCDCCPVRQKCHKTYIDNRDCIDNKEILPNYYINQAKSKIEAVKQ